MFEDLHDPNFPSFARLIDPTNFGTVKRYFRNPASEISQIVLVDEGYSLAEAAARHAIPSPSRNADAEAMELLESGAIRIGVDDMSSVSPLVEEFVVLLDTIDDDMLCFVIYQPPTYFVKVTNRRYE